MVVVASRAYGWRQDGTLDPVEAKVLRKVVADVLAGKSLRSVITDLNTRGVPTATGRKWALTPMRRLLLHPRMIAMKEDRVRGRLSKWPDKGREPMVTRATWEQLRVVLAPSPARAASTRTRIPGEAWLTGMVVCSLCGKPMHHKAQGDRPRAYACREPGSGHDRVLAIPLEDEVRSAMLDRIAGHGNQLGERVGFWSSRAGVEKAIRDTIARESTLAREFAAGTITEAAMHAGTQECRDRVASLRLDLDATTGVGMAETVTVVEAAARWAASTPRARRGWARLLIEQVSPTNPRHPRWVVPFPLEELAQLWAGIPRELSVA